MKPLNRFLRPLRGPGSTPWVQDRAGLGVPRAGMSFRVAFRHPWGPPGLAAPGSAPREGGARAPQAKVARGRGPAGGGGVSTQAWRGRLGCRLLPGAVKSFQGQRGGIEAQTHAANSGLTHLLVLKVGRTSLIWRNRARECEDRAASSTPRPFPRASPPGRFLASETSRPLSPPYRLCNHGRLVSL